MKRLFYTYIRQAADEVSLTEAESMRMRSTLRSYMDMHPIHVPLRARPTPSWYDIFAHPALAFVAVCAILGSSAGVSYAAESSLPGDVLYPLKVAINEPVRGALAVTPRAKADWAIQVAGERAKEAATLAAEKRLDDTTQDSLEASLVAHAKIATESIVQQTSEDPAQGAALASRFEARISEYERVITAIDPDASEHPRIATVLRSEREKVALARASAEHSSDESDDETVRLGVAVQADLASSNSAAVRAVRAFSRETAAGIAERIEIASSTIASAQSMATSDAPLARGKLRKALQDSEKIRTFVDASAAIHDRTGLTISQPAKSASRSDKTSRSGKKAVESDTAIMMQASTLATSMAEVSTSSTSTDASTTEPAWSDEHADEDTDEHGREDRLLPIPTPEL